MKFVRDMGGDTQRMLTEIYSPARVTAAAAKLPHLGVIPGFAFDLTTNDEDGKAWDFTFAERRQEARRRVAEQKPMFLVGSPMCKAFSSWQALNAQKRDPHLTHRERVSAMVHLRFVCELYELQASEGRFFLHEHPQGATSWTEACIERVAALEGVDKVTCDQ